MKNYMVEDENHMRIMQTQFVGVEMYVQPVLSKHRKTKYNILNISKKYMYLFLSMNQGPVRFTSKLRLTKLNYF